MSAKTVQITTLPDRSVRITREFAAPPRLVWDAHTKPELAKQWLFGPDGWALVECTIDLRVGGLGRYVMRHTESNIEMGWTDTYTEIDAPKRLSFTEIFDEDWTGGETLNTCQFKEIASGRTLLDMTMLFTSNEARDEAMKTGFVEGMELSYARIDAFLASGAWS
jgi:uncharacterized protein YndB with AHSA1/START domain